MRSRSHIFVALFLTAVCVVAIRAQDPQSPRTPGLLPTEVASDIELAQGPTRLADRLQSIRRSATSDQSTLPAQSGPAEPPTPPAQSQSRPEQTDPSTMRSILKRRPSVPAPVPGTVPPPATSQSAPRGTLREAVKNNSDWAEAQSTSSNPSSRPQRTARRAPSGFRSPDGGSSPARTAASMNLRSDAPSLSVRAQGPESIVVGTEATYRITVTNSGTEPADEVLIRAALPSSVRIVDSQATQGGPTIEAGNGGTNLITWQLAQVMARSDEQMTITVVPEDSQPFELILEWIAKPRAIVAQVDVREPKLEMAISGPTELAYGDTKVFRVTISNPGTGDAEDVSVNLATAGDTVEPNSIGTLAAGETRQLEIEITAQHTGTMDLQAVAVAAAGLRAEASHSIRVRRASLDVGVSGPSLKYAGTPATYDIRVANVGDATATDVTANVSIPAGATVVSGTTGATPTASAVAFRVGDLPPGTERVISVSYQLMRPGANQVSVNVNSADGLSASDAATTQVEAAADLKMIVNDPPGPMPLSQDVVYEVQIMNRGTKAATQINVVAQFSEGIEPTASAGHRAELVPGQVIFQPIDSLAPGETRELKITARADRAGNHRFRVEVTCDSPETRLVSEETTRFFQ